MTIAIVIFIILYIVIAGIVAAFWDHLHFYSDRWIASLDGTLFVFLWIVCVPVYIIFSVSYVLISILIGRK